MSLGKSLSHQHQIQRPGESPGLSFLPRTEVTTDQWVGGDGPCPLTTEYPRWNNNAAVLRVDARTPMRESHARSVMCAHAHALGVAASDRHPPRVVVTTGMVESVTRRDLTPKTPGSNPGPCAHPAPMSFGDRRIGKPAGFEPA